MWSLPRFANRYVTPASRIASSSARLTVYRRSAIAITPTAAPPVRGPEPAGPGAGTSRTRYPTGSSDQPRRAAIPHRPPGAVSTTTIATAPMATRYHAPYEENFSCTAKKMTAPMIGPSIVPMPPITTMNSMSAL